VIKENMFKMKIRSRWPALLAMIALGLLAGCSQTVKSTDPRGGVASNPTSSSRALLSSEGQAWLLTTIGSGTSDLRWPNFSDYGKHVKKRLSEAWLTLPRSHYDMTPLQFESTICELFRKLGYRVTQTPFVNDGGKDAIAHKGGETFLIECKRYGSTNSIGRRDLQIFIAAIQGKNAAKGFYVNTGIFTRTAREFAQKNRVVLHDRHNLPTLIAEAYPAGAEASQYRVICPECGDVVSMPLSDEPSTHWCVNGHSVPGNICKSDFRIFSSGDVPYCDECGSPMRKVSRGYKKAFWGWPRYPNCKGRPVGYPSREVV
jgi:hypothetical protein